MGLPAGNCRLALLRSGGEHNTTIFGVRGRPRRLTSSHAFDTHVYDIWQKGNSSLALSRPPKRSYKGGGPSDVCSDAAGHIRWAGATYFRERRQGKSDRRTVLQ